MSSFTVNSSNPNQKWRMLALIWLVYACFGITVGSFPPLVSFISKDLDLSSTEMGLVLGAWQLVYIFTASPIGTLIDKHGVRKSVTIGMLIILVSLVLRTFAFDFLTLFITVGLFGIGGPIISIGAPTVGAEWFDGKERGVAAGVYTTAPLAGVAIAIATAASVVEPLTGSWRGIALVYGSIISLVLVLWFFASIDPPNTTKNIDNRNPSQQSRLSDLLKIRNVQIVLLLALVTFLASHGFQNWLPTLLVDDGMKVTTAGNWVSIAIIAGAVSLVLIPLISKNGNRRLIMALMLFASSLSGFGIVTLDGLGQISSVIIWSIARSPMIAVSMLILMDTKGVGKARMGSAAGLFYTVAEVGGFSGPFVLGAIRDITGNLDLGILSISALTLSLVILMKLINESPLQTDREGPPNTTHAP